MSHFSTVRTQYTNKRLLIESLKNLGLTLTEHTTPVHLNTRWSDSATAHLVVSREQLNSGVDIGFLWQDNAYQLVADDYELRQSGFKFPNFRQDLAVSYAILTAQRQGLSLIEQKTENGQVQLVLQGV